MIFAAPRFFWLLLLVVVPLIGFYWWAWWKRQQLVRQFTSERLLGHLKVGVSPSRQKVRMALVVLAVIFLICALARPQWGLTHEEAHQRGVDIIVAIDTSNSMLAEDVSPNRLARAKLAALDLMRRAKSDRLGLVAFAGSAYLQCPLTLDDAAFSQSVDSLDTQTISQGGTAISEAIDEARKAFKKNGDSHRVLVIFSDGEDHEGDPIDSAKEAAKEGMIIFTIGVGTAEGEVLRIRNERGRIENILDDQGKPVKSQLDEGMLQQIALATKGVYLPLQGTKTMDYLYDQRIAPLPKSETAVQMFQHYSERFRWPIMIAIALLIVEIFLPDRKRRRSGRPASAISTLSTVSETVAIILFLALPISAWSSPSSALREYNSGNYQGALKDYNQLLGKKDDPRLHFNAGTAAYQSKQLEDAKKEFSQGLMSPDLPLQQKSYYNLGNTLYRIGEQASEPDKKQEAWENAVKQYESALKLNPQDGDAKFNQDFVNKQLELLKKQQQQQSKDKSGDKNKQDKQNQDQKNQDQKQGDNKPDSQQQKQQQDQQKQQGKDSSQNKQDSQAGNKSKEQSQKEQQQSKGQKQKPDEQDQSQQQASAKPKDKSQEEAEREAAAMAAGEMTPHQAEQMLDAQKDDDQVLRLAPPNKNVSQSRAYKNW